MEKSIKTINHEISKLNEELKCLESALENAITSAIDEIAQKQKIRRINKYCFVVNFSDLIGSVWNTEFLDWVESAKIVKKFLQGKPASMWVDSLKKKLEESQDGKIVVFKHTISCRGYKTVNKIPVSSEFINLVMNHLIE